MDRNSGDHGHISGDEVALRKESVDRNHFPRAYLVRDAVALRKESVDRNAIILKSISVMVSRSPQGERG